MAFSAGEIAAGLIYGEIVFRSRKVNGSDKAIYVPIFILKCRLSGRPMLAVYLYQAASGPEALFFELTF